MAIPAWVSEDGIAAQLGIAIVAVFGEKIRGLFRPKLELSLARATGHPEILAEIGPETQRVILTPVRYYLVCVTNRATHPEAREVEVLLTNIDIRGPDGNPQSIYEGALPLAWQHGEHYPALRTIGRASLANADLLLVRQGRLQLTPKIRPLNFPETMHGEQHIWLTVRARGLNGASRPLRLKIDWDGVWEHGDHEMAKHLVMTEDPR